MFERLDLMREFPARGATQVTIANMQTSPYNRWAFRNMRRILPTGNVWRGDSACEDFQVSPVALDDVEFESQAATPTRVGDWLANSATDGFVVLHGGLIVDERYGVGVQPHEPHLLMSVSKSFVGSLTGILVERGQLNNDTLVNDVLPELAGTAYDNATLRHVLDMTVGMEYDENYDDPNSDVALLDVAAGWRAYREGAPDNLRDYMKTMRPAGEHGQSFHYVSTNTDVLGWMIERVCATDFATVLSKEIWQPLGAQFDAYITLDRLGAPQTDGGLCVTTRDLARFGQMHLQHGVSKGRQIVPQAWIDDFRHRGDSVVWERGTFAETMPKCHYRSKWYTDLADDHHPYFGLGIHGQSVFIDPVAGVVIAKHSTLASPAGNAEFNDMRRAFSAIAHSFSD